MSAQVQATALRVGIIGTGLVGGSLLLALQRAGVQLVAVDADAATRSLIAAAGVADVCSKPDERLRDCDVVVLATPLPAILDLLGPVGSLLSGSNAVLTDVGGAKARVLEVAAHSVPSDVAFVGAHPMAGRAVGGFQQALVGLFEDKVVAVCAPPGNEAAEARVAQVWKLAGARTVRCDADAHDAAVARVSHLPYFMACATALVADAGDALAHRLAATGLKDTTRIATDATLRHVARENAALPAQLRDAAAKLEAFAQALEHGTGLDEPLNEAADARRRLYPETEPAA